MATSVLRSLSAALAVAAMAFLTACGGGDTSVPQGIENIATAVVPAQADKKRILATSAVVQAPHLSVKFKPVSTGAASAEARALAAEAAVSEEERLLVWAQEAYPEYFPQPVVTQQGEYQGHTYLFRRYPVPGGYNFAAVREDGTVWGLGPYVGSDTDPHYFGTLAEFKCLIDPTSCGPKLLSATLVLTDGKTMPAEGTADVPAKGTKLVLTYDQVLGCAGVNGTGVVGELLVTVTCSGKAIMFLPGLPGEERWPFASTNTVEAAGLVGSSGYPSAPVSLSFTTKSVASAKVFTGNFWGPTDKRDVSMIDRLSGTVTGLALSGPNDGNQFLDGHLAVSRTTGVVYAGSNATTYLYRRDAETGEALAPLPIYRGAVIGDPMQGIRGVASSDKLVCVVLGRLGGQSSYDWRNVMMCWNHQTGQKLFESPVDFVADHAKIPFMLHYSERNKKFYSLNGTESAVYIEEYDGNKYRDGFLSGTPGKVTEIDCEALPCRVTKSYTVGSVPQGIGEDPVTGTLYVTNSGDRSMTVITPSTGNVLTRGLPMFTGWQVPMKVLYDAGRLLVGDYMESLVVLDPVTLVETQRIHMGNVPMGMAVVGDELWVTLPRNVATGAGQLVGILDRSTLTMKRTLTNVGAQPWAIVAP